jgi:beta-aspartyl-peptidase (threonine type)
MNYKGATLELASNEVIDKQSEFGGKGGLIALDKDGNVAMPFNTAGMYRGYIKSDGSIYIGIYGAE